MQALACKDALARFLFLEAIAVAAYRFNEFRIVSCCFYLIAKALDVRVHRFRFRDELPAPSIVEQIFAGNHLAGVVHQAAEQLELTGRKVDGALFALGNVGVLVQRDAACRYLVGGLCGFDSLAAPNSSPTTLFSSLSRAERNRIGVVIFARMRRHSS